LADLAPITFAPNLGSQPRTVVKVRRDFPEKSGLSAHNLKYMRAFAEAHTDPEVVQQVVAQLP
jgi:hypothetical protein